MSENYAHSLNKVVVAQIVRGFGFAAISQSACDALTDIMQLYIEEIGTRAKEYSELASRTDCNFHDVHQALIDMSVDMNELHQYQQHADEIPFAKPIAQFPIKSLNHYFNSIKLNRPPSSKANDTTTSNASSDTNSNTQDKEKEKDKEQTPKTNETTNGTTTTTTNNTTTTSNKRSLDDDPIEFPDHIPSFLPAFPPGHTFLKTPLYGQVITDSNQLKKTKNKQKRRIEKSLTELSSLTSKSPIPSYDLKDQPISPSNTTTTTTSTTTNHVDINNNNNNNNKSNTSIDIDSDSEQDEDQIKPTPLQDIPSLYFTSNKPESSSRRSEEPRRVLLAEEDTDRQKKRQKCERILSLTHENTPGSGGQPPINQPTGTNITSTSGTNTNSFNFTNITPSNKG